MMGVLDFVSYVSTLTLEGSCLLPEVFIGSFRLGTSGDFVGEGVGSEIL